MQTLIQKKVGNTCRNGKDEFKVGRHMEFCFHGGQISENKSYWAEVLLYSLAKSLLAVANSPPLCTFSSFAQERNTAICEKSCRMNIWPPRALPSAFPWSSRAPSFLPISTFLGLSNLCPLPQEIILLSISNKVIWGRDGRVLLRCECQEFL